MAHRNVGLQILLANIDCSKRATILAQSKLGEILSDQNLPTPKAIDSNIEQLSVESSRFYHSKEPPTH
jgi:hypothetical protein